MPKVQILLPTIERWHCIDKVFACLANALKPDNISIVSVVQAGSEYKDYVERKLREIFKDVTVVQRIAESSDHDMLRFEKRKLGAWNIGEAQKNKTRQVAETYKALKANAQEADYYWIMEDDTLFPLDFFPRAMTLMDVLNADIIAGVSYRWRTQGNNTNFCNIRLDTRIGKHVTGTYQFPVIRKQESGIIQLGMTGLCGLICKKKCLETWDPHNIEYLNSGADCSFSLNAMERGYKFYGCWDLTLPHITKYEDGSIEILGKIDKTLLGTVI